MFLQIIMLKENNECLYNKLLFGISKKNKSNNIMESPLVHLITCFCNKVFEIVSGRRRKIPVLLKKFHLPLPLSQC